MLPVRIRFHPPCDPAASRKFPRNRDQPAGNPVLFAKGFQFHDRRSSVECQNLIGLFCSHTLPLCLKGDLKTAIRPRGRLTVLVFIFQHFFNVFAGVRFITENADHLARMLFHRIHRQQHRFRAGKAANVHFNKFSHCAFSFFRSLCRFFTAQVGCCNHKQQYNYAAEILNFQQKAILELSDKNQKLLHIGVSSVPSLYLLPELLSAYHQEMPDVRFRTSCSDSLDVIRKVTDGTCDIGLVGTKISDTPCRFLPVTSDELVIAAPATPHFQACLELKDPVSMLLKEPFLLREDTSGTKQETLYYLRNRGLSLDDLNVIAVMDDAASLIRCITLGMGISILSRATVQNDAQLGKLLIIPLEQSAFLRKLYIVYSSTQFMSEQTAHFFAFMKQFYAIS